MQLKIKALPGDNIFFNFFREMIFDQTIRDDSMGCNMLKTLTLLGLKGLLIWSQLIKKIKGSIN